MEIRYIGKQTAHRDRLYGTGAIWGAPGDVQRIEDEEAGEKMLARHPEVYERVTGSRPKDAAVNDQAPDESGPSPEAVEIEVRGNWVPLCSASKQVIADYASEHFGVTLDRRLARDTLAGELYKLLVEKGE